MKTYLVVPSTLGNSSRQRIYVRDAAAAPLGLADYRSNPAGWKEAGEALNGRVVCLDAPAQVLEDFRACEPFAAPLVVVFDANRSFAVEVQTVGNGDKWTGNGCRYPTREQADAAGRDLASRWMAVTDWRTVPSVDAANYEIRDGAVHALPG